MFDTTFFTIWRAALADLVSGPDLASNTASIGIMAGFAILAGPISSTLVGAFAGQANSPRVCFLIAGMSTALNVGLLQAKFEETLPAKDRKPVRLEDANPFSFLKLLNHSWASFTLMCTAVLQTLPEGRNIMATNYLYMSQGLGWAPGKVNGFISALGISLVFSALIVKKSIARLGLDGHTTMSNIVQTLGFIVWGNAGNMAPYFGGSSEVGVLMAIGLMVPGGRKRDGVEAMLNDIGVKAGFGRGYISAALMNWRAISNVFAPLIFGNIYSWATTAPRMNHGLVFTVMGLTQLLAEVVFRTLSKKQMGLED